MKPLAKLVIQKLREYKKSCSEQDETYLDFADLGAARPGENYVAAVGLNFLTNQKAPLDT